MDPLKVFRRVVIQISYANSFRMEWEATLKDSLLSLLTTPKGLGLVSEAGLLGDCLAHMCIKWDGKLQVHLNIHRRAYPFRMKKALERSAKHKY